MNRSSVDLSGEWSFAYSLEPLPDMRTIAEVEASGLQSYPCTVPGNFELDLQAAGLIEEPFYGMNMAALSTYEKAHVWYWRAFAADQPGDTLAELCFEGLDCYADVYLNGELIASCDNMLVEHHLPVDGLLSGGNELLVHIRPAVVEALQYDYPAGLQALRPGYEALHVRKAPHMYGWDIMPRAVSAGIWRPVQLCFLPREGLDQIYLETLDLSADQRRARLVLHYAAKLADSAYEQVYELRLQGVCGDSRFEHIERMLFQAGDVVLPLSDPELWWPRGRGEAKLYDCQVTLLKDGQPLDEVSFRHGVRTVRLERSSVTDDQGNGAFCFWVNGERVFALGSNWVPVDAFHSRDAARIPRILAMAEDLNCNMLRCWGGNVYEDDLFYELCDEKGLMVWQDFCMACAIYPQDTSFRRRLAAEARQVVRRLRRHACVVLWAGDNECDAARLWGRRRRNPSENTLTRQVLPDVLRDEDVSRPYLPSSPYVDETAFRTGDHYLPENHLWGPRDYYKSDFYRHSLCHFASEIGYHGCPSPDSIRKFISPDKVWPYQDNEEWILHASSPLPGVDVWDYRIELMAKQIRELFGAVPDNLDDFAFASQVSQAEAKKFFIELFRANKWRRTGILWWNLMDGWPQFSDAIVDYYFCRKLAYEFIKRSQASPLLVLREPENWLQELVVCNDTRQDVLLRYSVSDVQSGELLCEGEGSAYADAVTVLDSIPYSQGAKRFYLLRWESALGEGLNHYLAGNPPFDLETYRRWLDLAGILPEHWRE